MGRIVHFDTINWEEIVAENIKSDHRVHSLVNKDVIIERMVKWHQSHIVDGFGACKKVSKWLSIYPCANM